MLNPTHLLHLQNMTNRKQPGSQFSTDLPAQHEIAVETGRQAYATLDMQLDQNDLGDQELTGDDIPPPAYGEAYGEIHDSKNGSDTGIRLTDDGRVDIRIDHFNRRLSQILSPALKRQAGGVSDESTPPSFQENEPKRPPPPPLNIVIQVVGSRGDVQPFIALGKVLKNTYGHRVRIATHPIFRRFVRDHGLEFFSIGGDPSRLMAFMVKNPGLRPDFRSVARGDIGQRRRDVAEYIQGCWRSCYRADDGTDEDSSAPSPKYFVADCIIANPPSFAHVHCAEKLGIPLHIMFTMPYSPTTAFPHPLANIKSSSVDAQLTNLISYTMIDLLQWQGIGDIINRFRAKCLDLDPISMIWAPGMLQRLKVPHTYCWSKALIPKPKDWGSHISVSGFSFLDLASNYRPPRDLQNFIEAGPPPVYIGFGSIVLEDPDAMTRVIFQAAKLTGQRILLSKGWGGIGADELHVPENVFLLGSVPHDWLFERVSCVVHHGGAGTTAAGIAAGKPTVVVPFFGDQSFWGAMIARAGAGPDPIPHKQLTAGRLADAISFCLKPETIDRAKDLASKIATERGSEMCAQLFHQHLEPDRLCCTLVPSRSAVWRIRRTKIRLSAFAASTLVNANLLDFRDLKLFRAQEYYTDEGPLDPVSGGFTAFTGAVGGMMLGLAEMPSETWRALKMPVRRSRQESQASISSLKKGDETSPREEDSLSSMSTNRSKPHSSERDGISPIMSNTSLSRQSTARSVTSVSSKTKSLRERDMLQPTGVHMTKGAGRFVKSVIQGPVNIAVNYSRGVHNVPKLWGDDTVRPQERVTDMKSGARAIGREFGLGWYDGITGLVTQPWRGAQQNGATGFVKGVGKGIGGFVAKPTAAMVGVLGHSMQGVNKEMQKLFSNDVQSHIAASRAAQGYEEWLKSSDADKQNVIDRWKVVQRKLKKKDVSDQTTAWNQEEMMQSSSREAQIFSPVLSQETRSVEASQFVSGDHVPFSHGDTSTTEFKSEDDTSSDGGRNSIAHMNNDTDSEFEREEPESQKALAEATRTNSSAEPSSSQRPPSYDPGHLAGTTQTAFEAQQNGKQREKTIEEKTEEEIVLEYVRKQSLLEEQNRKRWENGTGAGASTMRTVSDEEDEELQRVLRLSLLEHC